MTTPGFHVLWQSSNFPQRNNVVHMQTVPHMVINEFHVKNSPTWNWNNFKMPPKTNIKHIAGQQTIGVQSPNVHSSTVLELVSVKFSCGFRWLMGPDRPDLITFHELSDYDMSCHCHMPVLSKYRAYHKECCFCSNVTIFCTCMCNCFAVENLDSDTRGARRRFIPTSDLWIWRSSTEDTKMT